MLTLLLVRHASHGLLGRVLAGRMPGVSLSGQGQAEAGRLAGTLVKRGIARILSSPLDRARETAAIIAARLGRDVEIADEINEIDCGRWTGAALAKLADDPDWDRWNHERAACAMPEGEGMKAVEARAMGLVWRLAAESEARVVALVSHSDVIKAVAMAALGLSFDRHDHLAIDPASVTTLHVWRDYARVVRLNEVAVP